jgi:P27 family predicted phage terminase small subunit
MVGRKPIPSHIRLLKNDTAHRHLYKDELIAEPGTVIAPDTLSEVGTLIFNKMVARLEELGIASPAHTEMLTIYATNQELVEWCQRYLSEKGLSVECDNGRSFARPEVGMLQDAQNRCLKILEQFGLSPSASVRVKIKPPQKKVNAFIDLDEVNA